MKLGNLAYFLRITLRDPQNGSYGHYIGKNRKPSFNANTLNSIKAIKELFVIVYSISMGRRILSFHHTFQFLILMLIYQNE